MNFLIFLNLIALITSKPGMTFSMAVNSLSVEEREQYESIDIDDRYADEGEALYGLNNVGFSDYESGYTDDLSVAIPSEKLGRYLKDNYDSSYIWNKLKYDSASTSDVTNSIPIEMGSENYYDEDEMGWAIKIANVDEITNYGGCGPIAIIGILDYFARYLGYNQIISDPTNRIERQLLATEVLINTEYHLISNFNPNVTYVEPKYCSYAFNEVIKNHSLDNNISSTYYNYLSPGNDNTRLEIVKNSIDRGMPVTLKTGLASGSGEFAGHYTNIYAYETWVGVGANGESITRTFLKARLNHGKDNTDYYCHSSILNCAQIALITYDIFYDNTYRFGASDFSEEFVNSSGGGQYFFYEIHAPVNLNNGLVIDTRRLRTSYIENQYLVMSPNRSGAGEAYLELLFPQKIREIDFNAALWGGSEDVVLETFSIKYKDINGGWRLFKTTQAIELSSTKSNPSCFRIIFPADVTCVRLEANHPYPTGSRNKGRIVLDRFFVNYNE